ncbi:MAG: methylase, partial [Stygiobacter sp.]
VTGVDIATNLIEQARSRAQAEGLTIKFDEGDAEQLPYRDATFDTVVSLIGAMFAPRAEMVAHELVRVCRHGGRIAMANWTPSGFIGQMFKINSTYLPPPQNIPSPVKWGEEDTVSERLHEGISGLQLERRMYSLRYPFHPSDVVEFFRTYYGPTQRAFAALDTNKQISLRNDLVQLWEKYNQARDGTTFVESEYLEVIATRK